METLRVQLPPEKAQKVRAEAMKRYGYSKGSISKAVNVALDAWLHARKPKQARIKAKDLMGIVKGVKGTSVEIQHRILDYW